MHKEEIIFIAVRLIALLTAVMALPHVVSALMSMLFIFGPGSGQSLASALSLLLPVGVYGAAVYVLWIKTADVVKLILRK